MEVMKKNSCAGNDILAIKPNGQRMGSQLFTSSLFIVFALLVIVLIIGAIFVPTMLNTDNLLNVLRTGAITGMVAVGATIVLLVGEIDLSLGSTMVFSLIIGSKLLGVTSDIVVVFVTCLCGMALGFINGVLITVFKVKSLMATLGTLSLFSGLAYFTAGGHTPLLYQAPNYLWLGKGSIAGIPIPIIVFFIVVAALSALLHYTKYGRETYYTGANTLAAWLSGVNIRIIKLISFMVAGLCASIAGVFQVALLNEIVPTIGTGYELTGLAIAIFGGTSMVGGKGSVLGTCIAVMAFQLLLNILTLSGCGTYMEQIIKGAFLIIIVIVFQKMEESKRI